VQNILKDWRTKHPKEFQDMIKAIARRLEDGEAVLPKLRTKSSHILYVTNVANEKNQMLDSVVSIWGVKIDGMRFENPLALINYIKNGKNDNINNSNEFSDNKKEQVNERIQNTSADKLFINWWKDVFNELYDIFYKKDKQWNEYMNNATLISFKEKFIETYWKRLWINKDDISRVKFTTIIDEKWEKAFSLTLLDKSIKTELKKGVLSYWNDIPEVDNNDNKKYSWINGNSNGLSNWKLNFHEGIKKEQVNERIQNTPANKLFINWREDVFNELYDIFDKKDRQWNNYMNNDTLISFTEKFIEAYWERLWINKNDMSKVSFEKTIDENWKRAFTVSLSDKQEKHTLAHWE